MHPDNPRGQQDSRVVIRFQTLDMHCLAFTSSVSGQWGRLQDLVDRVRMYNAVWNAVSGEEFRKQASGASAGLKSQAGECRELGCHHKGSFGALRLVS